MNGQDATETTASPARRACLVEGCACKDARIVSTRRATYFATVAKARGETADRIVAAETEWRLPVSPALDVVRALAADSAASSAATLPAAA
jgi:hypothetical protein